MEIHHDKGRYLVANAILDSDEYTQNLRDTALECVLKYKVMEEKIKLTHNIKRVSVDWQMPARCHYVYEFVNTQWLESIDDLSSIGIEHDSLKEEVINALVGEFKIALNAAVFGDPAGYEYIQELKKNKEKYEDIERRRLQRIQKL